MWVKTRFFILFCKKTISKDYPHNFYIQHFFLNKQFLYKQCNRASQLTKFINGWLTIVLIIRCRLLTATANFQLPWNKLDFEWKTAVFPFHSSGSFVINRVISALNNFKQILFLGGESSTREEIFGEFPGVYLKKWKISCSNFLSFY